MSTETLDRDRAVLVVVDVQEAFRTAIPGFEALAAGTGVLVRAARALGIPLVVTEQYPRGLGETVPEVREHLEGIPRLAKTVFSAARADGFGLEGRRQALLCGVEAHVCVSQTALDLLGRGSQVHVAADATGSRTAANREAGLRRMERAGAVLSTVEMALFELVGRAGTADFKAIQGLVK